MSLRSLEPESSASANSAIPASVDGGGFEPPKSVTADLQSAPFGHSGTHPYSVALQSKDGAGEGT